MTAGVFVLYRNPAETVSKKGLLKKWNNPFCFAIINGVLRPLLKGGRPFFGLPAAEHGVLPEPVFAYRNRNRSCLLFFLI
jgi:hypothetical protein